MKSTYIFAGAIVVVVCILYLTLWGGESQSYIDGINKERKERDNFMRTSAQSPFAEQKEDFKGLNYFLPDEKYRVIARLIPIENKKVITLTTSDGKEARYIEYAYAEFDLDNRKNKLLILQVMDMGPQRGDLFLPFGDKTSALETYGAGRYLDIKKVPVGSTTITLDFNHAYNPYCAYIDTYSCPFPPPENLLNIAIRAGEKTYHPS